MKWRWFAIFYTLAFMAWISFGSPDPVSSWFGFILALSFVGLLVAVLVSIAK